MSIRTCMFNPDEAKYAKGIICELPYPADDTRLITKAATAGLQHVFRDGYAYSKAESCCWTCVSAASLPTTCSSPPKRPPPSR